MNWIPILITLAENIYRLADFKIKGKRKREIALASTEKAHAQVIDRQRDEPWLRIANDVMVLAQRRGLPMEQAVTIARSIIDLADGQLGNLAVEP